VVGVGSGCIVDALTANGESPSANYGGTPGIPDFVMDGMNLGKWLRNHLRGTDGELALFKGEQPDPSPMEAYLPKKKQSKQKKPMRKK
jgi:hypothetical protein